MGSKAPHGISSLLWKLLALLLIIQACGVYTSYAKQLQSDSSLDDTIDIDDLFDDDGETLAAASNQKVRITRDLDVQELLDDELQPVAEADDDSNGSWLMQGVKRVRRWLGAENEKSQKVHKVHKKRSNNHKNSEETLKRKAKREQLRQERQQIKENKKLAKAKLNKHSKRNSYAQDEYEPTDGSGFGDTDGDANEEDEYEKSFYRVLFTINEPWSQEYRKGRHTVKFMELHHQLEIEFRDLFAKFVQSDDVDDFSIKATLLNVSPTTDLYKIHVAMHLEIPTKDQGFGHYFEEHLRDYHRLDNMGAEMDEHYYFRLITDPNMPVEVPDTNNSEEVSHSNEQPPVHDECDENPEGFFHCKDGQQVPCSFRCNNVFECDDETDEDQDMCRAVVEREDDVEKDDGYVFNRPDESHNTSEDVCDEYGYFQCTNGVSINCQLVCDNENDCSDESDEDEYICRNIITSTPEKPITITPEEGSGEEASSHTPRCRGDDVHYCSTGEEICADQLCDGNTDCSNGEDESEDQCGGETETVCADDEFKCDERRCLPREYLCNGATECADETDEANCPPRTTESTPACSEHEFRCDYNHCLSQEYVCDGRTDCNDQSDESNCPRPDENECQENQFRCRSGTCIDGQRRCDQVPDCPDGDDEDDTCPFNKKRPEDCTRDQFFCDDECHDRSIVCNNHPDCADRRDEANCYPFTTRRPPVYPCPLFTCPNGKCYSDKERCNGISDCDDGSDELNCCASHEFRCANGDCVRASARCNGYAECRDQSDEQDCQEHAVECSASQFRCDNGQCINAYNKCDGRTDCFDSSDEKYCPPSGSSTGGNPQLNLRTYPGSQIIKQSREVIFRCRDEGPLRAKVKWSRPGGQPLPVGTNDKNGRLEIPNIRMEDAGQYICEAVGYPRHVAGQQVMVHLTVEPYNTNVSPNAACNYHQATCMNGECIDKNQICDGIPHCTDGSDEHSCSHGRKCHPNQFMCRNTKCIDRIWRCDGENDCGDNSDEESCDPEPSGAPCRYDEFQCRSGHCIPKSFQCDDTNDCVDASDEIGCMAPVPIRPPPPRMDLSRGDALNLTCVATGVPVPVIVWRLNWGHVPEQCVSKSHAGVGTLYCGNMQTEHSGAYSCEIINNKGTTFVTPDTVVTVDGGQPRPDVCPAGFFNMLARTEDDCITCFCFGISNSCRSANLFNFAVNPPITSHRVVNVELSPYSRIVINESPSSQILNLHHGVQFRASNIKYGSRESPYLALPNDYMGNQLKSYGGSLHYELSFVGSGRPTSSPDVIITGSGNTLTHTVHPAAQANINNKMSVQFVAGNWYKPDGRRATREEIMMVLVSVDNILIRLSYIDATEREVELKNIAMDSAAIQDTGLGSASLVEQCTCPAGYVGDSCETCAPGYERQPGGAWLGRCVPIVHKSCAPGTYGDPRRGIPCRECPCPQTGSNNFASGCQLGPDNDVICNCNEGYTGRRCEICAPGYQGNPFVPGGGCHRMPEDNCNAEGTLSTRADGSCECKPLVVGPRCDSCAPESFHLNAYTYSGCTECFCMGLTKQCSSSSWYRETISSNFASSRIPHGFTLIRDYDRVEPSAVAFQMNENSLEFSQPSTSEALYWNLPAQFLGNQLTAYGGKLNYTLSYNPLPGGQMSRNNAPDVVIKSGQDLTIIHYRKAGVNPSQSSSYAVPIIESAWQRSDGQMVPREHLLMALSKVDAIYIKATYTTRTKDGALTHVSMDIATPNNIGTVRGVEVEECRCPKGYEGLSCEKCTPGYTRTESGLYLGFCEPCDCYNHSNQCDPDTGVCLDCRDNTDGENCDVCAEGYEGNAKGGTPYDCQPYGGGATTRRPYPPPHPDNQTQCEHCHEGGTQHCYNGYCNCKTNVEGPRCDRCRSGTYGLSAQNPEGCEECFCSGKSNQCRSSTLWRQLIPVDFFAAAPLITDDEGNVVDHENVDFSAETNTYTYSQSSYTQKYWSLRGSVLGNQLGSYGGELSYNLDVKSFGHFVAGNDVIVIGNGVKLLWSRDQSSQDNVDYNVRLHEDENWTRLDRGRAVPATRSDFMTVLSNIEHILIRATPKIPATRTSLRDVILESSVEFSAPGAEKAHDVEVCTCPAGYSGNSCESCSAMHYRDNYGSCERCPCQDDSTDSCGLDQSGYVKCHCKQGYIGDRCQHRDEYVPEPPTTARPQPDYDYRTQITVSIQPPEISIVPVGGSLTLYCTGRLAWDNSPVRVSWYKLNGQLPYNYEVDNGVLQLVDLQIYDSGTYICQAVNNQTQKVFEDEVSITISESTQRTPAAITNLPPHITFEEYAPSEINCIVSGNPMPTVTWTRTDGQISRDSRIDGTRLIFDVPRRSDEGNYRCEASNEIGSDEKYVQVYIRTSSPQPPSPPREEVYIEPPSYTGHPGENVHLTCQHTTSITLNYEWSKDGYPIYNTHNLIINSNMLEIRESTSRDSGIYTCVAMDHRAHRNYTSDAHVIIEDPHPYPQPQPPSPGTLPPVVKRLPEENRIIQGKDFSLTCEASGSPYPTIKWTKVHESLADNIHVSGNVLRIINARTENRGMYVCIAENSAGNDQSSTIIEIEPRERPTAEIHPTETQTIYVGGEGMLYCYGNGIPEPTMQWRRTDGKPLSPRHKEQSPGNIIISDVLLEDAGDYECVAENDVGRASAVTTIRVIESPIIQIEPSEEVLSLTEGDELKVVCSASGFPSPSVQWLTEDQQPMGVADRSQQHFNQAFLEVYRVTQNDAKSYKCVATNEAGMDERYVTVEVKPRRGDAPEDSDVYRGSSENYGRPHYGEEHPHRPQYPAQTPRPQYPPQYPPQYQPHYPPSNVYQANTGELVTLSCNQSDSLHPLRTYWERVDGRPLPDNTRLEENSLIINHAEEHNAGEYRCNIYDNLGSVVTVLVAELVLVPIPHITILPKIPLSLNSGENVDISCEVTGEQPIDVSWHTDNNRPLSPSAYIDGKYLRFTSITPADAGRYYCRASNRYGNSTEMAEVKVNHRFIHEPPQQQPYAQTYPIDEGKTVYLDCVVRDNRIAGNVYYEWSREDGRPINSHTTQQQVLTIYNVRKEDEGRYVCNTHSSAGQQSAPSYTDLIITPAPAPYQPPHVAPHTPEPHRMTPAPRPRDYSLKLDQLRSSLRVGESTEVECYASDNAYANVVWERADGAPLPPNIQQIGNRLLINDVTAFDAGNYLCKCKTDEGDLYTTSYELAIEESEHEWKRPKIEHANVGSSINLYCDDSGAQSYRWSRQYGQMQSGRNLFVDHLKLQDVQSNDAGTYICTTTNGHGESVDHPTILVVTGAIPQFHQNPISYMAFPALPDSNIKLNFEITFRPEQPNGLLLYNGQKRNTGDYIALSLNEGYPEFRFDFDGEPMVVRAEQPVTMNEWHTIHVNRLRRDGLMQIDNQHPVAFPTLKSVAELDLIEDLYLGGVPHWDMLPNDAIEDNLGFVGCISRLSLMGSIIDLMKEAKYKEGITSCQPCLNNPCQNEGICIETQTEMAFTCICQQGWTGHNCAVKGAQCTPGICGTGRCENTEMGIECLCPLNKTGDRCQYVEHLNEHSLAFKSNSYAAYGKPRASKLNVKFQIRPDSLEDAVLLYTAESKAGSGDFVAVVLKDKHIELIINTGTRLNPAIVRSLNEVPLHQWTEVEITRRFGTNILRVGSEPEQKGKASGMARSLYIKTHLYIGGYDHENIKLNRDVNVTKGFNGCIRNLYEYQRQINLIADIQDAANIQNCGETNEIDQNENFEHYEHETIKETEHSQNLAGACDSDPCENGGTCRVVNDMAVCSCNLGHAGKHCEEHITIEYDGNFHGNGFIELDRSQFNNITDQTYSFVAMVFSTNKPNGLLLWWGQNKNVEYTGQDFMALAIVDGYVEFRFRLNGEETHVVNSDKRVDDGIRHIALIKRTDNTGLLELDHVIDAGEARPSGKDTMSLPGHVFIGGAPDLEKFTGGRYTKSFDGCVRVVEGEATGIIHLGNAAVSGENVDTCPFEVDGDGGTEPPVV